ncbi:hypothetical protein [Luteipulveratus mongoliensis]|nr:hypothetical protein [Luteipulveratus mongoliensis]
MEELLDVARPMVARVAVTAVAARGAVRTPDYQRASVVGPRYALR